MAGQLRFAEQRSMRAIHRSLWERGVSLAERTVTDIVHRYTELLAPIETDPTQLVRRLWKQDRVVLAMDGIQYAADRPVLWVLRDVLSGRVFLVRTLMRAQGVDLEALVGEISAAVPVPITAVICTGPGATHGCRAGSGIVGLASKEGAHQSQGEPVSGFGS
jgi:hypothetical protein